MKSFTLLFCSFIIFSCNKNIINDESKIIIKCEKIIIQDSIDDNEIAFLISYYNPTEENIDIYANTFSNKKNYKNIGIFIKNRGVEVPLEQFLPDSVFSIQSKSKIKLLYSYGKKCSSWKNIFSKDKAITKQLKKIHLFYKPTKINTNNNKHPIEVNITRCALLSEIYF
ncbi:hypothetical protein Q361_12715 [Flavobacterium croceum DSM 17960]|uniref:Lipoprotein n=1 Tax=Flavobacterium croceum DSM 17960 TaxID=1121886 RepID=A0A2S4N4R9_9FLAO|nr:hypothetical protein [Flavobacterium croceum]POS00728.1 hypothetical protein Q361_12715 [Flavobacterium croceum DSM 17960]